MAVATMKIKIEKDGKLKITTDDTIPQEHHENADDLLKFVEEKQGSIRETEHLAAGHVHTHDHEHSHVHQ